MKAYFRSHALTAALLALLGTAAPIRAGEPVPAPVPAPPVAEAPRTIADLACPPSFVLPPSAAEAMLKPARGASPPRMAITPEMRAAFRKMLDGDPAQLCRYRDENRALPADAPGRVVFIGDSITEGWKAGAPGLFSGAVLDRGISGQITDQMLLRFREDVLNLNPRVVHIMAGINDINTPAGSPLTLSNIASMIELAQAHHVRVVLGSITPSSRFWANPEVQPGPQIVELNRQLQALAMAKGVRYVDYYTPLANDSLGIRDEYSNEGLHPNQSGYDVMTPLAAAAIRAELAKAK